MTSLIKNFKWLKYVLLTVVVLFLIFTVGFVMKYWLLLLIGGIVMWVIDFFKIFKKP